MAPMSTDQIVNFLRILAWPLVVLYVLNRFHIEISNLINRVKSITGPGGIGVETAEEQRKVEETEKVEKLSKELEDVRNINTRLQELADVTKKSAQDYQLLYHFEKTYRLIFGSQLQILKDLEQSSEGQELAFPLLRYRASGWYEKGYALSDYMNFLINSGLVEFTSGPRSTIIYKITTMGRLFLLYLVANSMFLEKPN